VEQPTGGVTQSEGRSNTRLPATGTSR